MTEFNIYEVMDEAIRELEKRLPESIDTDDWQWNDSDFQFVLIWGDRPENAGKSDPYRFCYNEDEESCGNVYEQLNEWLERWFFYGRYQKIQTI